jgi:hypothetical protein
MGRSLAGTAAGLGPWTPRGKEEKIKDLMFWQRETLG